MIDLVQDFLKIAQCKVDIILSQTILVIMLFRVPSQDSLPTLTKTRKVAGSGI